MLVKYVHWPYSIKLDTAIKISLTYSDIYNEKVYVYKYYTPTRKHFFKTSPCVISLIPETNFQNIKHKLSRDFL